MAVVDASVYVALINAQEKDHASSWAWFARAQHTQEPLVAPVILLAEVAAAVGRGVGDPGLAHQVVHQLQHSRVIDLLPVTMSVAEQAAAIAIDHRIRGCDAVYVALAAQLGDCLVTLDHQQLERATAVVDAREPRAALTGPE